MVAVASFFGTNRLWHLINVDSGDEIEGDYETEVSRNIAVSWARHTALSRHTGQTQYLHGNPDTVTFGVRVFQSHFLDRTPSDKIDLLTSWTKPDPVTGRPPIVLFFVGDGDPAYGDFFATIESISNISFDSPTLLGGLRGASCDVNLVEFHDWTIESRPVGESRYHHARDGDYMELLAVREYGDPLLGDVIRKRHPDLQVVQVGDVVKLSPLETIREESIIPTSIPLRGLTHRKDSAQKTLRGDYLERLNRSKLSAIVPEGV